MVPCPAGIWDCMEHCVDVIFYWGENVLVDRWVGIVCNGGTLQLRFFFGHGG